MTRAQLDELLRREKESPLDGLEARELEVLSLISQGSNARRICEQMELTPEALVEMKQALQGKLKLKDEALLIQFAAKQRAAT